MGIPYTAKEYEPTSVEHMIAKVFTVIYSHNKGSQYTWKVSTAEELPKIRLKGKSALPIPRNDINICIMGFYGDG
jgi:hypothetical protein